MVRKKRVKPLEQRRRNTVLALGLFALSPLPSAQLFEAAGLAGVRLLGFTAAFFVVRTISYAIYAGTASSVRETSIGESFRSALTSPIGLGTQFVMIMMLVGLMRIDWRGLLHKRKHISECFFSHRTPGPVAKEAILVPVSPPVLLPLGTVLLVPC